MQLRSPYVSSNASDCHVRHNWACCCTQADGCIIVSLVHSHCLLLVISHLDRQSAPEKWHLVSSTHPLTLTNINMAHSHALRSYFNKSSTHGWYLYTQNLELLLTDQSTLPKVLNRVGWKKPGNFFTRESS
jgi:hypothetical protein